MRLTAADIVAYIDQLPKNRTFPYINPRTKGLIKIVSITKPEGPIVIKRYDPSKGGTPFTAKDESISAEMIWRVANAFFSNQPINFDRVLGGSYNTRSVLETLIAHTPQFYYCYPGRIESTMSNSTIKNGHKHLMWCPERPHELGVMVKVETDIVISEIPNADAFYDSLVLPEGIVHNEIDIEIKRRHSQIQVALIMIGQQLGFRTWIAQNDKGIMYNNQRVGEMTGVVNSLRDERLIAAFEGAYNAAKLIDCIWFKNGKLMPAVMEVEHSTGVTSGLTRMKGLQDALPPFPTRYVIVAPDEDRNKVLREANRTQFQTLDVRYFPYSAVEELYSLCQRRKIRGVTEDFLDSFMEPTIGLLA
ncbi:restriction endonuclease [Neobacillus drentensis]|uniref:restriction endonuclease n=1 Tax=Neobacillus drentensis TaxID=220684 RepID=UPI0028629BF7|nr:restriction endonuclease [Neobacillus drentensis]MDR7237321.1 type II restriction enzyme [Neobacillus drentensis]